MVTFDELHRTGLAQEYDVYGTSTLQTRPVGDGGGFAPGGGDRGGTREDPGRDSVDGRGYDVR